MKTILVTVLLQLALFAFAFGQSSYSRFFETNRNAVGVESFTISTSLFRFLLDSDEQELKDLLKKLDEVSFFISDNPTPFLISDLSTTLPEKEYKEFMVVKNGTSTVRFKAKEKSDKVDEVIMIVTEPNSLVVMCIKCNITFKEARALASSVNTNKKVSFRQ
jgi:hypothetical protein